MQKSDLHMHKVYLSACFSFMCMHRGAMGEGQELSEGRRLAVPTVPQAGVCLVSVEGNKLVWLMEAPL